MKNNNDCWNGGIYECGNTYEFSAVSQSRFSSQSFYYACDTCGYTEKFFNLMR